MESRNHHLSTVETRFNSEGLRGRSGRGLAGETYDPHMRITSGTDHHLKRRRSHPGKYTSVGCEGVLSLKFCV